MAEVKMPGSDPVANELRAQYPSNSMTQKAAAKKESEPVTPVAKGRVQKETLGKKIRSMFIPADVQDVKDYVFRQVLIPGLKDGVMATMEMLFFGEVRTRYGRGPTSNRTSYSYQSTNGTRVDSRQPISRQDRATHNFQNIVFETAQDAEMVIDVMLDKLERDGFVTVATFYVLTDNQPGWADEDWGWRSFTRLEPRRMRDGFYIIDMQPPVRLR